MIATRNKLRAVVLGLLLFLVLAGHLASAARGETGTWTTTASGGIWSSSANWANGSVADGTDALADFSALTIPADNLVHLDGNRTVGSLQFGDLGAAHDWTIDDNGDGNHQVMLAVSSGSPAIAVVNQRAIISATIAGIQGVVKTGNGTLVLSGSNSFTGGVTIQSGTLELGSSTALGSPGLNSVSFGTGLGGTLRLAGNNATISGLSNVSSSVKAVVENDAAATAMLTINGIADTTYNGLIQNGTGGALSMVKDGSGTLTLKGANTYTGGTLIRGGTVVISDSKSLGNQTPLSFDGGTLKYVAQPFSINTDLTATHTVTFNSAGATIDTNGNFVTFNNLIGNGGSGGLTKAGLGTLSLGSGGGGMSAPYRGDTKIAGGTLTIGISNFLASSTLDYNGYGGSLSFGPNTSVTIGGIKGNQNLALTNAIAGSVALTVGGNDQSTSYSGQLSGTGSLLKTGVGTLTLSGNQTYTGATTINQGSLVLGGSLASNSLVINGNLLSLPNSSSSFNFAGGVLLNNGATNISAASSTATSSLGAITRSMLGGTIDFHLPTSGGAIVASSGSANAILTDNGRPYATIDGSDWAAKDLANTNIVGLSTLIGGYTPSTPTTLAGNADIASQTNTTLPSGATTNGTMRFNQNEARSITIGGVLSTSGILVTPNVGANASTISGGTVKSASELLIHQFDANGSLTISSVVGDVFGGITKTGPGELVLSNTANSFTTALRINGGRVTTVVGTAQTSEGYPDNANFPGKVVTLSNGGGWNLPSGAVYGIPRNGNSTPDTFAGNIAVAPFQTGAIILNGSATIGQVGGGTKSTLNAIVNAPNAVLSMRNAWNVVSSGSLTGLQAVNFSASSPAVTGGVFEFYENTQASGGFTATNFSTVAVTLGTGITLRTSTVNGLFNNASNTIQMGSLSAPTGAVLDGEVLSNTVSTIYQIGSLATDSEFDGTITTSAGSSFFGTSLYKVGSGKLTLGGTLSYGPTAAFAAANRGGITDIQAGTLALIGNTTLPAGSSAIRLSSVNIRSGATLDVSQSSGSYLDYNNQAVSAYSTPANQQVYGLGTVVGNYRHGAGILAPGDTINSSTLARTNAAGTLTFNNRLNFYGSGVINFDITSSPSTGNDLIRVAGGDMTGTPTLAINLLSMPTLGSYSIIQSSQALDGSLAGWSVSWTLRHAPPSPSFSADHKQVLLNVIDLSGGNLNWRGTTDSNWNQRSTANWHNTDSGAINPDVFYDLDNVNFLETFDGATAPTTTTVSIASGIAVAPASITVNNSAVNYTISGAGKITGTTGLVKQGTGALTLSTSNDFKGDTVVSGGTLILGSTGAISKSTAVLNGGGLQFATGITTATIGGLASDNSTTIALQNNAASPAAVQVSVGNTNVSTTFSGSLTGLGSLVKSGSGTLTLSGDNNYQGTTTVSNGVLSLTGSIAGNVSVSSSGTLQGSGTVGGSVAVASGGSLAPGVGPGILQVGSLTMQNGSQAKIEIGGLSRGNEYDSVVSTGATALAGTLKVSMVNSFTPLRGNKFDILDWSTRSGTFATLQLPQLPGPLGWNTSNLYMTGALSVIDLSLLPGDMNLDGKITLPDLDLLELALVNPAAYIAQVSTSQQVLFIVGDADESGTLDNGDLQGLINELIHGTSFVAGSAPPLSVPEPASISLLLTGAIAGLVIPRTFRRAARRRRFGSG